MLGSVVAGAVTPSREGIKADLGMIAAAAAALASGILAWLADYPRPVAMLAWIAPAPVLIAALRRPPRDALWLGVLWGAPLLAVFASAAEPDFFPAPVIAGLYGGALLWKSLELFVTVWAGRRLPLWMLGWVFASAVVVGEWSLEAAGKALWWNTATAQIGSAWLRPVAAIGGPYLISFLVLLVGGTLAVLATAPRRAAAAAGGSAALAVGIAVLAGHLALPTSVRTLRVAAVVYPIGPETAARWDRGAVESREVRDTLDAYDRLTRRAVQEGARLVVWPEYAVSVRADESDTVRARVGTLARATGATIVAGYIDLGVGENRALLASPQSEPHTYTKQQLVPGFETSRFRSGSEPFGTTAVDGIGVASLICYDAAFTAASRAAARTGLDVLAVAGRHWAGIEEVYPSWSAFRAAENGVAMVQAVRDGRSMLIDPTGRVLASESSLAGQEVVLVGDLPIARAGTAYSQAGNWPVLLAAVLLAAGLLRRFRRTRRGLPDRGLNSSHFSGWGPAPSRLFRRGAAAAGARRADT